MRALVKFRMVTGSLKLPKAFGLCLSLQGHQSSVLVNPEKPWHAGKDFRMKLPTSKQTSKRYRKTDKPPPPSRAQTLIGMSKAYIMLANVNPFGFSADRETTASGCTWHEKSKYARVWPCTAGERPDVVRKRRPRMSVPRFGG